MKMDNKKLVKVLVISGTALLILFIFVRLAVKNSGDRITDMPTIGELKYDPKKVKEESKVEQFEQQKKEKDRREMGQDNSQYVIPNFTDLSGKKDNAAPAQSAENNSTTTFTAARQNLFADRHDVSGGQSSFSRNSIAPAKKISPQDSKLNYHSDYFKNNDAPPVLVENTKADNSTSKNPFGTITSDNTQGQKQNSTQPNYYSAEIYGDQSIQEGGIVLIRNTVALSYLNISIPRNSILYGQATFRGNRVLVNINRTKTPSGEFSVSFGVKDNDKIEGLYYKAPIDETVDNTKSNLNAPSIPIPGAYGGIINSITQATVQSGKDLMKRAASLNLEEGYKVYIIPK